MKSCFLFAFLLIVGCADNLPTGHGTSGNPLQPPGLIPTELGLRWVYVDSLFQKGTVSVEYDTVRIAGSRNDGGRVWWRLEGGATAMSVLFREYMVEADTVRTLQRDMVGSEIAGLVFLPPRPQPFTYSMLVGGDAMMGITATPGNGPLSIPAGTYTNWTNYAFDVGLEHGSWTIEPGVGILRYVMDASEYSERPAFQLTSTLVAVLR